MTSRSTVLIGILCVLAGAPSARGATIVGADWGGANLAPANGDVLSGVFTNVGTFTVAAGTTVWVAPGVALEVHAVNVVVAGTLNGTGRGFAGGNPVAGGYGAVGLGPGAGNGGIYGDSVHSSGGGGGGYGAVGGSGGNPAVNLPTTGGPAYGTANDLVDRPLGSGGGAGGSNRDIYTAVGGAGGNGGGSIMLEATTSLSIAGSVIADGAAGVNGGSGDGYGAAGGGGGSGGTVELACIAIDVTGTISARGGNGGVPNAGNLAPSYAGGGGGGAGGRVKLSFGTVSATTPDVSGGTAGANGSFVSGGVLATNGGAGTVYSQSGLPVELMRFTAE